MGIGDFSLRVNSCYLITYSNHPIVLEDHHSKLPQRSLSFLPRNEFADVLNNHMDPKVCRKRAEMHSFFDNSNLYTKVPFYPLLQHSLWL